MTSNRLSIASSDPPGVQDPALPSTSEREVEIIWLIVTITGIAVILAIFFVWKISARRSEVNPPVTHQAKAKGTSASRFCTNCGHPTGKNDKFCRKCGSALQGE
jgi:hypothetical protein